VHVVEQDRERCTPRDVSDQPGQALQQPRERRIALGQRAAHQRDPAKQARQVVEQSFAELHHLAIGQRLEERIYRLRPEAERGTGGEWIALRNQSGHLAVAPEQLPAKPALARPGVALQQDHAELSRDRAAELIVQNGQLIASTDELGARTGSRAR
jgi:hypothetical protein